MSDRPLAIQKPNNRKSPDAASSNRRPPGTSLNHGEFAASEIDPANRSLTSGA
jgi:hypothetical protein